MNKAHEIFLGYEIPKSTGQKARNILIQLVKDGVVVFSSTLGAVVTDLQVISAMNGLTLYGSGNYSTCIVMNANGRDKFKFEDEVKFRDYPAKGDYEMLDRCKGTLVCDKNGKVVFMGSSPQTLDFDNFAPLESGLPPVYGLSSEGHVICHITLYNTMRGAMVLPYFMVEKCQSVK